MKHDLALQGNIGDIELLIFPSNHLPEKFQRKDNGACFFLFDRAHDFNFSIFK